MNKTKMIPHRQNHSNVRLGNCRNRGEIDTLIRDRKTRFLQWVAVLN